MTNFSSSTDPTLPDTPEPTTSTEYVKIFNDTLKAVIQPMTWDAAEQHREADGAKLTSILNEWIQAHVELLVMNLNAPFWIGLNKEKVWGGKPLQRQKQK